MDGRPRCGHADNAAMLRNVYCSLRIANTEVCVEQTCISTIYIPSRAGRNEPARCQWDSKPCCCSSKYIPASVVHCHSRACMQYAAVAGSRVGPRCAQAIVCPTRDRNRVTADVTPRISRMRVSSPQNGSLLSSLTLLEDVIARAHVCQELDRQCDLSWYIRAKQPPLVILSATRKTVGCPSAAVCQHPDQHAERTKNA